MPGVFATRDFGLWFEDCATFVIADLHLGYEAEARSEGAGFPSTQFPIIRKRISSILKNYKPKRLVIAGDMKHSLGRNRRQEWDEVSALVTMLEGRCEPIVLRGNHDNFLVSILRRSGLNLEESLAIGRALIVHGDRKFRRPQNSWLVLGHEHPSIKLFDRLGASATAQCFLWSSDCRTIVLPAFSPISFGRNVVRDDALPLSPMLDGFGSFELAAINGDELLRFGKVGGIQSSAVG